MMRALNRLAKWRTFFAGWQLGTRSKDDAESNAVRDHREATLLLRTEGNALVQLLIRKGVFTEEEWTAQMEVEAEELCLTLEKQYPGISATQAGLNINREGAETMKRMHFKP